MASATKAQIDPYEKLSQTLNTIPNGFMMLEDGTHLKMLEWIYEPWEADLASKLKLAGESIRRMARRLRIPRKDLAMKLSIMEKNGQLHVMKKRRGKKYGLLPFVIGLYEEQLHRMDSEFAQLFETYVQKTRGEILFTSEPAIQRVIPVNSVIKTDLKIHTYNQAETLIRQAKSWGIRDCICRKQQELLDNRCDYPMSICISFSSKKNAYEDNHITKPISKNRAIELLYEAEEAGLVHTSMNIEKGQSYICNCCTCCCGILQGLVKYDQPYAFVKSDYVLSVTEESCTGCGKCIDRCQFNVLSITDKKCHVDDNCIGCGVCALVCSKEAMFLEPRNKKDISKPPRNIVFWMIKRAFKRRVNPIKVFF